MITYTLRVAQIREETEDTITICFKQPALKKIKYEAGQYLTLIFRINGRRYIRPYSFSSAPLTDLSLEITVKRVPNGIVSNHIHDVVQVGDSIEVLAPMGTFVYREDHYRDQIFLWGVGSGITPLISITKQILANSASAQVNLIYGNRNYESTIFLDFINGLLEKHSKRFKVWHFYTQLSVMQEPPFLVQGRISKESVFNIMEGINVGKSLHYICGPLGLKESVKEALFNINVSADNILSEDFELVKDPKDFGDIETRQVLLLFKNQRYDLEVIKGKSVLESALEAGIEMPYSCQTGNCDTCKAKIRGGSLRMIGLSHERKDLFENDTLLCCSYPLTEDVCLEV